MRALVWPAVLRAVIIGSAFGAVLCVSVAAPRPLTAGGIVLFTALAAVAAVWADSHASLPFLLVFGWCWVVSVEAPVSGWSLPGAIALSTYHTAAAMASLAPWKAPAERAVATRWAARLVAVWGVTAAVWGAAHVFDSPGRNGHAVLFGLAVLLLAAATWLVATVSRPHGAPPP